MPLWSNTNSAAAAPKYKILANSPANGQVLFQNSTPNSFYNNEAEGVYDINAAATLTTPGTAGWNLVRQGTGYVTNIAPNAPGNGYANTDYVTLTGGLVNAVANVVTNGTGNVASLALTNPGKGIANLTSLTTVWTTGAGSGATLTITLGGRAGRVTYEPLVAMGSIA
ncbi:MAG: hypothetical protein P4L79_10750 [Legionella sp.]|uniref:hypothetical protein n=1 Tax=Legionella sp. TaxID=459 RepID=UPI00283ADDE7|nr:hypothetical protein [Legionella sp.]